MDPGVMWIGGGALAALVLSDDGKRAEPKPGALDILGGLAQRVGGRVPEALAKGGAAAGAGAAAGGAAGGAVGTVAGGVIGALVGGVGAGPGAASGAAIGAAAGTIGGGALGFVAGSGAPLAEELARTDWSVMLGIGFPRKG